MSDKWYFRHISGKIFKKMRIALVYPASVVVKCKNTTGVRERTLVMLQRKRRNTL